MKIKIIPKRLSGTINAIPSKSHAHRVLIAQKLSQIQGQGSANSLDIPTFSDDIAATKGCLSQLDSNNSCLDCHESGSTLRFMIPVAMALKDEAVFAGTGKLPSRPISPLKEEMEKHGCTFYKNDNREKNDNKNESVCKSTLICRISGRMQPGTYRLAGNISSQFITGLLMALPLLDGDSVLELTTALESAGYVDLTLSVLKSFGIIIEEDISSNELIQYKIPGNQKYTEPADLSIEGDWSNAAFWLVCGALGGNITCRGLDISSSQRDKEIIDILKQMGADIKINGTEITCSGTALTGTNRSVKQIPDLVPVMSAVMSLANGTSHITDAERLKIKESNRLETVNDFLSKLGANIKQTDSGLTLTGRPSLAGGEVSSHNDHRIAMAAAAASCGCDKPVIIDEAEAVKKSYPGFFKDFTALGGECSKLGEL